MRKPTYLRRHRRLGETIASPRGARLATASAPATAAAVTTEPAQIGPRSHGAGNSNALQIDDDGDGYGVGSPKGPDADDQDPEVNTTASVLARYGSIEKFLEHKGLKPARIFYLATNGDDSHAGSGHPDRPYRTFARVVPALGPGDLVLFAAGTYKSDHSPAIDLNGTHGKKDKPVVIMAVPGSARGAGRRRALRSAPRPARTWCWRASSSTSPTPAEATASAWSRYGQITLRNMEVKNQFPGVKGMQNLHDLLIERMVIHDNPGEHGIYLGCREDVNSNITVRGCRIYRNAQQGFQHNGRVKNLLLEDNLIHTNGQAGVQLMMGVCDSTIRHNLIFNNAKQGVSFFNYVSSEWDILPYDMHNNVVEDNVIWVGRKDWHDQYNTSEFAAVQFNDSTGAKAPTLSGNIRPSQYSGYKRRAGH